MATLGQIVDELEEALFVGRGQEMVLLRAWLAEAAPASPRILNVTGPGGIGKSSLLRAFYRELVRDGRRAVLVDLAAVEQTSSALVAALTDGGAAGQTAQVDDSRPVILLDHFDPATLLSRYVHDQLLPGLDSGVRVVISGRRPLGAGWAQHGPWHALVRPVALTALSPEDCRVYAEARGVTDARVVSQITRASGGHPLALALACDMATQLGVLDFSVVAEWRLVVRTLVAQILEEVDDEELRDVIQACSIVRQFDESVLGAVSGSGDVSQAFERLCHLSVVRPSGHGLALHDGVRHMLAADLRWRNPDRYRELRDQAFAHYRERMQRPTSGASRDWLLSDCLYLVEDDFLRQWAYSRNEPRGTWVDSVAPGDRDDALRLFATPGVDLHCAPEELSAASLGELLRYDGTDVRVLRDQRGGALAFCLVVPVCRESLDLLPAGAVELMRAYWDEEALATLAHAAAGATAHLLTRIVVPGGGEDGSGPAALARDLLGTYARGGTYFLWTSSAVDQTVARLLGYQCLPEARVRPSRGPAVDGFVLDLARIGVRPWLEAMMQGRPLPRGFPMAEVRDELRTVLLGWRDDALLERSPLRELVASGPAVDGTERGTVLREAVLAALAAAREAAPAEDASAYRAVELAYLERPVSNERLAERMALSRSSFYRALRRGIAGTAEALLRTHRGCTD